MSRSSPALSTVSTRKRRVESAAQSPVAWERVLDRLRMKLKGQPSRSAVFGLAGLRASKMLWSRRYPDLRLSVVVNLARVLRVKPGTFLELILEETKRSENGHEPWTLPK